ncbi:hypothetical protein DLM78_18335 [Leptospira stimsonii]|uniref:Uncharacterized protein n=1 Tax=Leptospira stimsonii TaxID=2202203 RepID=A0A8B3CL93_9LEPT|nr:hypothetical protein DLM78_18335 [Leptospira stimsonii]
MALSSEKDFLRTLKRKVLRKNLLKRGIFRELFFSFQYFSQEEINGFGEFFLFLSGFGKSLIYKSLAT